MVVRFCKGFEAVLQKIADGSHPRTLHKPFSTCARAPRQFPP